MSKILIEKVKDPTTISQVKLLADKHRPELGFHSQQTFIESSAKNELLAAKVDGRVKGFVRFHHRRDHLTTLYEIATDPGARGKGVGRQLVDALVSDCKEVGSRCIRLFCPAELPSNQFYERVGFVRSSRRSHPGKSRPLNEWVLAVLPHRPISFVASLTSCTRDLKHLTSTWEAEGLDGRPFDKCIITPLFIEPKSFEYVRYMHDKWGVEVFFDSGGFFVQQGKIRYDELFARLLDFYLRHDWAEYYVLPDYVPTSKHSPEEVSERVFVTAAEGVKFLKRLPRDLRGRALGVLQGHTPDHLRYCFDAFLEGGLQRIGFGSFDTTGVKSEINLMTDGSSRRLSFVRDLIHQSFIRREIAFVPDLHLFGVSSPNVIEQFRGFLATSFDSSGWQRTAGYGNVYLPFQGRKNVTHGGASLSSGAGLSATEFYSQCELTGHSCPFCLDFSRLQRDRFARMWHNAIVFNEMVVALNSSGSSSHQTKNNGR
jgi:N-acetylglutamate synthase-like GNAT family acetyltransferase